MSYFKYIFIRLFTCISFVLFGIKANAQVSLLQKAIDKLGGYQNFSYEYVEKTLDFTIDTTIKRHKDLFKKAPGDETFGYLFSLEANDVGKRLHTVNLYDGRSLALINLDDSTYDFSDIKKYAMPLTMSTLPGFLKWLKGRPEKKPVEITADTSINGVSCYHSIFHVYDTIINKEYYHTNIDVFINKVSSLPERITIREKLPLSGNVVNYYIDYQYANYKFNQKSIDIASMTIPTGFHPSKNQITSPLLSPGMVAPDWTLYTTDGKQISLSQLKGKIVLMDFFFIGCAPCMESLHSLDEINERYKGRDFVLVSISDRDSRKAVAGFKKKNNIKNAVCADGAEVAKAYHLPGAPLFYVINKNGKIVGAKYGYDDDFEPNMTRLIDSLLKNKN